VVKEEWPREGSTSWSFACVKKVMREDLLCDICNSKVINNRTKMRGSPCVTFRWET
jgi:hypothetical protein